MSEEKSLHSFSGQRSFYHLGGKKGPHKTSTYGRDSTGTISYNFNSLGFRGKEYDANAKHKLFVSGSSYAFAPGISIEDSWPSRLNSLIAQQRQLTEEESCLMNFSEGGASNDYVSRMAVSQSQQVKPDLLVAEFVIKNRSEGLIESQPFQIGPWLLLGWRDKRKAIKSAPAQLKAMLKQRLKAVDSYYDFYNDELGTLNVLKNMLLVQSFCQANEIPYLLIWTEHQQLDRKDIAQHAVLSPLLSCLDRDKICSFGIADDDLFIDKGADNAHPGPNSHKLYADRLFQLYQTLYSV